MGYDVLAHRSQKQTGEPAVAASADHEQIGILRKVDEQLRRVALLDPRLYADRRIFAEDVPNRSHQQPLRRLAGFLAGIDRRLKGDRTRRRWRRRCQVGRQRDELRAVVNRLVAGPFERLSTGRRAIDADEDSLPLSHMTLL